MVETLWMKYEKFFKILGFIALLIGAYVGWKWWKGSE